MADLTSVQKRPTRLLASINNATFGMPKGAIGLWFADRYNSSAKAVPNAVASSPLSQNYFRAPRRLFNNTNFWTKSNLTVTDESAAGPDGKTGGASTIVASTTNWFLSSPDSTTIPAGTYTISVWAKSMSGSSESFAFSTDNAATRQVKNVTTSWQQFSHTFTLGSVQELNKLLICSATGSPSYTAVNIAISDFCLLAGSSAAPLEKFVGHAYLGVSRVDATVTTGAGYVDLGTIGAFGLCQFDDNTTFSTMTVIGVGARVTTGSDYHAILSRVQSYLTCSACFELAAVPTFILGSSAALSNNAGLWAPNGKGYFAFTCRHDGTNNDVWLNKSRLFRRVSAVGGSPPATRDWYVGALNGFKGNYRFAAWALYRRALTDTEVRQAVDALQQRCARNGIALASERVYVGEGDSTTAESGGYALSFGANASPSVLGGYYAVSGTTLSDLTTRATTVDAVLPSDKGSKTYILSVLIGANDLAGYSSAANYITDLRTYCQNRRKAGWKVVICTILPKDGIATHNSRRATVNTDITTNFVSGGYADAVADFAADSIMGPDNSYSVNGSYWTDGTHPAASGHARLEAIIRPVINAL